MMQGEQNPELRIQGDTTSKCARSDNKATFCRTNPKCVCGAARTFSGSSRAEPPGTGACSHDAVGRSCPAIPTADRGQSQAPQLGHSSSSRHYSRGVSGLCDKLPPLPSRGFLFAPETHNGDARTLITRCEACNVELTRHPGSVTMFLPLEERKCDGSSTGYAELCRLPRAYCHGVHEHGWAVNNRRSSQLPQQPLRTS